MIRRASSFEAEVELEVVEPGDVGVDVLVGEFFGEVFVVVAEEVGVGGVVESDDEGVVMDAEVAFEAGQEGAGEAGGLPGVEGGTEA